MQTPFDLAQAAVDSSQDEDAARLRFYGLLADTELFLLLEAEAQGESLTPKVFDLEDGPVVLAFDTEARLAEFADGPAAYASLPGRVIAGQLAGQGVGLGVNLGVAPSATLLPPEAMEWLTRTLTVAPGQAEDTPVAFAQPNGLPEVLLQALAARLTRTLGKASAALLSAVTYRSNRRGHLLAFLDATDAAQEPLAQTVAEALTFSGLEAGELDVAFLASTDPAAQKMAGAALRFDMVAPAADAPEPPKAPGTDPDRPPKLR